jgi:charged multivesicular body protein 4A/B
MGSHNREQLREQHELTQEIGNAITSMPITEPIDEDELEKDLADLEQEKLDEQMLKSGTVPVSDSITKMPAAADGPCEFYIHILSP